MSTILPVRYKWIIIIILRYLQFDPLVEPLTIFAPSNDAFKYLRENPWTKNLTHEMMQKLLGRAFVLHRKILPDDIKNEMIVSTMSGEKLRLNVYPRVNINDKLCNLNKSQLNNFTLRNRWKQSTALE